MFQIVLLVFLAWTMFYIYWTKNERLFLLVLLVYLALYLYYHSYVVFYDSLLQQLNDDKLTYVHGPTSTSHRYAVTYQRIVDIVYDTIYFGDNDKDLFVFGHNHAVEKNPRDKITLATDLVVGGREMCNDEWSFEKNPIIDMRWDRGPLVSHGDRTKEELRHVYPGSNELHILAQKKRDYYNVLVMYNGSTPMDAYLMSHVEFHTSVAYTVLSMFSFIMYYV